MGSMASHPTLGYRRLRGGRRSVPGQLYLLTTITQQRTPHFLDTDLARLRLHDVGGRTTGFPAAASAGS